MKRPIPLALVLGTTLACGSTGDEGPGGSGDSDPGSSTTSDSDDATSPTNPGGTSSSGSTSGSTSSGATSGTSTTSSGGGSSGGGFIDPPDGGVTGQCDPMAQDCPEGEKCTAYSTDGAAPPAAPWDANKCVPVKGSLQEGDPCEITGGKYTGDDECDVGLICLLSDDDGLGGGCVEFCDTAMNCTHPNANCAIYNDGALPICLANCDPLLQDCPDGQGCYGSAAGDGFICFKFSGMAGEGVPGGECGFVNACQPGAACLAPDAVENCAATNGCCSPYCDLGAADPNAVCNPSEECTPWFEAGNAPPQFVDVGVCSIPV